MTSSTIHRPALHSTWLYVAAAAVLTAAVIVVLITALHQGTTTGHTTGGITVPYHPLKHACFEGRTSVAPGDLDRSLCAPANR